MTKKGMIELLKSGDFTIAYHDNCSPSLYKGKHEYDELPDEVDYDFDFGNNGYIPEVVEILVEALGGKSDSV